MPSSAPLRSAPAPTHAGGGLPAGPAGPRPEGTGTLLTAACHRGAQGEVRRDSELTSVLPRERGLSSPRWSPRGPGASCVPLYAGKRAHKPKELARVSQRAVSGPGSGAGEGRCPLGGTGTSGGCFPAPLSAAPACPPFSHRKLSPDPTLHRCPQRRPIRAGHGHRPRKPFPRPTC